MKKLTCKPWCLARSCLSQSGSCPAPLTPASLNSPSACLSLSDSCRRKDAYCAIWCKWELPETVVVKGLCPQDQETPQEGSRALILQLVVAPHAGAGPLTVDFQLADVLLRGQAWSDPDQLARWPEAHHHMRDGVLQRG
ncbi:hypothetical protein EYF80_040015 [Liparis tanakae]|uniref:Uncharacterized protein n=1 Tax=Liparis tanakae TaxID=230148 RepID=A0A4Z2G907_9TELE|nr:hypothetical protein EYF80_040015 [Liparis tanakae]